MMNETLGKWHFWLSFIGVYCTFMPMYFLGFAGNVRRYSELTDDYLIPLIPLHKFITVSTLCTGAVQFIFLFNLIWSRFRGPLAPANPWEATTLEWSIPSPPPIENFEGSSHRGVSRTRRIWRRRLGEPTSGTQLQGSPSAATRRLITFMRPQTAPAPK